MELKDVMKKQKVLILGSTSFGGRWFVDCALKNDFRVIGVSRSPESMDAFLTYKDNPKRSNYEHHVLDLNHDFEKLIQLIETSAPEYVVDFAGQGMVAPSWEWPEQWYQTNVISKVKIINFLNSSNFCKKYIRVSTPEVYGSTTELINEGADYNPTTPYSISHATIDMHIEAYQKQFGFPAILTRFANFYGPGQQLYRIVPRAICSALMSIKLPLHGGGSSVRSFIHGKDVAEGLLGVIRHGKVGSTYHFSTKEFVSIKALVENIAELIGIDFMDFVQEVDDRRGKDAAYLMNCELARSELNWSPKISLREGLIDSKSWILENFQTIRKLSFEYEHRA